MGKIITRLSSLSTLCPLLLIFCFTGMAIASIPINVVDVDAPFDPKLEFEYYKDTEKSHTFESIVNVPNNRWQKIQERESSFGFSQAQFWVRFQVKNTQATTQNMVVEIGYPLLDDVTFYTIKNNAFAHSSSTGDSKAFYPREIDHPNMLHRLQLQANEEVQLYLRVQTEGSVILPVKLWQENRFFEHAAKEQKIHFFYYGFLVVIMLINLAIFFTLQEKLYLFYSLATSGYLVFFATSRGYAHQLFFPDFAAFNTQLFLSSMPFLALFSLLFAREFLQTKQYSPKLDIAIRGMIYFEYVNLLAAVTLDYNTAVQLSAVSAVVLFVVLFLAGPISIKSNKRAGIFFTVAWLPLTIGFAATAGRSSGILANNFFTEYAMQIGSGLEALILTLALADRLYHERELKIIAQGVSIQKEQQRLAIQDKLTETMMRDPITKLANRNRFEWLANKMINEHPERGLAICVARVTRLNEITRTLGLLSAERIVKEIANRINPTIAQMPGVVTVPNKSGGTDAAFQLSSDTFGILLHQKIFKRNMSEYKSFIQRLMLPIEMGSLSIELIPRVGCALYPEHGQNISQLIRNALVAMESSEHAYDQVVFYDNIFDIYSESRLTLMSDLKEALRNNEPELHYQPKVDLKNNSVIGVEALIRWQHPKRGFVSPAEFVLLAEQTGVIKALTLWVIERAMNDFSSLRNEGYTGSLSINISAKDLLSESLKDEIESILNRYQIDPSKIFLELTETAAMVEPEVSLHALKQLASLGLKISIDDFGAGYSSLSYLQQLPASEIKLDRSLIIGITKGQNSQLIVQAMIDLAHRLKYSVIAEGVEDAETHKILKELGCDGLQGFWICKPKPVKEIAQWLTAKCLQKQGLGKHDEKIC